MPLGRLRTSYSGVAFHPPQYITSLGRYLVYRNGGTYAACAPRFTVAARVAACVAAGGLASANLAHIHRAGQQARRKA